jgi:6,7-dimethyl-8-ribityllumazine synthase
MRRKRPKQARLSRPGELKILRRARIGVICADYHEVITRSLEKMCLRGLKDAGVRETRIESYHVPGCFEIPLLAQTLAEGGRFDALIALGVIIRGETLHFDLVAGECARGVMDVSLRTGVPVIFEVLATVNRRDAVRRAGNNRTNKGYEAAQSTVALVTTLNRLRE